MYKFGFVSDDIIDYIVSIKHILYTIYNIYNLYAIYTLLSFIIKLWEKFCDVFFNATIKNWLNLECEIH